MFSRLRHYLSGRSETRPTGGEGPRGFVGGLWDEMGDLQFKFLLNNGLQPENVFLDIACGSLRLGCRIIPFLGSGNYLGIDIKEDLIEHGKAVELGEALCRIKTPEFIVSDSFEFKNFLSPQMSLSLNLFFHTSSLKILCFVSPIYQNTVWTTRSFMRPSLRSIHRW
jgi:SAM-dependent methyltransferase